MTSRRRTASQRRAQEESRRWLGRIAAGAAVAVVSLSLLATSMPGPSQPQQTPLPSSGARVLTVTSEIAAALGARGVTARPLTSAEAAQLGKAATDPSKAILDAAVKIGGASAAPAVYLAAVTADKPGDAGVELTPSSGYRDAPVFVLVYTGTTSRMAILAAISPAVLLLSVSLPLAGG
jgi:hypothetical protein